MTTVDLYRLNNLRISSKSNFQLFLEFQLIDNNILYPIWLVCGKSWKISLGHRNAGVNVSKYASSALNLLNLPIDSLIS